MSTMTVSMTLDVSDPDRLSSFWSEALGYQQVAALDNWRILAPADGTGGPKLILQGVPEARSGKNRMHLDMWVDDIEKETERLEGIGATRRQDEPLNEHGIRWFQLADPEGNEFCVAHID